MNQIRSVLLILPLLASALSAQVLQPATIYVTSTFTNPPGAVKSRLENASGPRIFSAAVAGRSAEAVPRTAASSAASSLSDTSATVPLTVDAAGSPQWQVSATLPLSGYGGQFFFGPSANIATAPGGSYTHTFSSVVSIVDITFSAAVSGGAVTVTTADGVRTLAQHTLPSGNRAEIVVPGGEPLRIQLAVDTGSGGTAGSLRRVVRLIDTWAGAGGVPANTIQPVNLNIGEAATTGSLTGTFDVVGAAELAGGTTVTATYFSHNFPAYGAWLRTFNVPGDPASGAYTLGNLPSSASIAVNDPGVNSGYGVQGTAFLKNSLPSGNQAVQFVRTKMIGAGVPAGGAGVLGSVLEMTPGTLNGTITLNGPPVEPGITPVLHGIVTSADADANADGVPDGGGNPFAWLNASLMLSRTAEDTSSYGGTAQMILERTTAGAVTTCEYELLCPSPTGGPAVSWTVPAPRLLMANNAAAEAQYFNTSYELRSQGPAIALLPGASAGVGYSIEMGEVVLTLRSSSPGVNIWQPQIQSSQGGLTNAPASTMIVEGISAYGWPTSAAAAGQRASLRTVLPAGTYTIRPSVNTVSASGAGSAVLAPFTITVPARGRVTADNGLTINADTISCVGPGGRSVAGDVSSNGVAVTGIQFRVDGGPLQNVIYFDPPFDPTYELSLPPGLSEGTHTLTVIVTTADGRTASITRNFTVDLTPPVMAGIDDISVIAPFAGGMAVNYPSPVASDDCGSVSVVCVPHSGTFFFTGTTPVTCTAYDAAGNSTVRTFNVTVLPPCPPPVRSHLYQPAQQNYFQYPNNPAWHDSVAMTIEAWVKREDDSRIETIISQDYLASFWFGFAGNKLRFYRSGGLSADSVGEVFDGAWTHVGVTYDATTVRFYINGQPAGSSELGHAGTGNAGPITIGADFTEGGFNYGFHGRLDEIRLYAGALPPVGMATGPNQQYRNFTAATFGSGGAQEDHYGTVATTGTLAPQPQIEGMMPRWLHVPRGSNPVNSDGTVDLVSEYNTADIMVIRYDAGAAGIRDALAYFTYRDEPGDRALYIGVKGVRDVIAPWTRDQSFLSVYLDPASAPAGTIAGPAQFRFNSRALDGTLSPGIPAASGFQRGNGAGNYAAPAPGDPLLSAPSPFGLIGAAGDSVEFRFELSTLTSDWQKPLRMALAHHWISGVGQDAIGPAAAGWTHPATWAPVVFSRGLPALNHARSGDLVFLSWQNAGCDLTLETSTTMLPGSWTPLAAPVDEVNDGLLRRATVDTSLTPRAFFRLRR